MPRANPRGSRNKIVVFALLAAVVAGWFTRRRVHRANEDVEPAASAHMVRLQTPLEIAETIYDGKLGNGWQDWGWGRHDLPSSGPAKIVFAGYAGLILYHATLPTPFGGFTFRYKAPAPWGSFLSVTFAYQKVDETKFPRVTVAPRHVAEVGDGWREVLIPWTELNPAGGSIDRILIAARRPVDSDWVLIDKVGLTKGVPRLEGALTVETPPNSVQIRCAEPGRSINPLIYGVSLAAFETGATANRIGGNPISRLNWDLGNAWNTGNDWFFENVKGSDDKVWDWVNDAVKAHVETALVVPMLGWVAKDTTAHGFPVSKFGPQQQTDPYRHDAGNGRRPNGEKIPPGPPSETSTEAPPEMIERWVRRMRELDEKRGARGVRMYILDNEPSLWDETHRDVHPAPLTYDELLDRTLRYAGAVRRADPEALIAGPAEWGWTGYFYSAKDRVVSTLLRPDRRAHGDLPLVAWYLQALAAHEQKTGERLLDVLDLHFYPAAQGIYGGDARTDREAAALRFRATRALWDPTYHDESWIDEPVRLIPRMREWVAQNYPGRRISIGEWSFGADEHISGGLATAEALGRFGEQGLDAAFFWGGPKPHTAAFWAFRAYRNFDGKGGRFLDWSVPTHSPSAVSLFASRSDDKTHVVAILINPDTERAVHTVIDAASCGTLLGRRAFSYAAGMDALSEEPAKSGLEESLPPSSIRVLDLTFRPTP